MLIALVLYLVWMIAPANIYADGDETLGPPSIDIESGSGFVASGTGTETQPAAIDIFVPGRVAQALLYWVGRGSPADDTITVNGTSITGDPIGSSSDCTSFRADITSSHLVHIGGNTLTIEDMDFASRNDGVGVLVVFRRPFKSADIQILDGSDFAYIGSSGNAEVTVKQTFFFEPQSFLRIGHLSIFVGDAEADRPDKIEITVGEGTISRFDLLASTDGAQFDTFKTSIVILPGVDKLAVQLFSEDDPNGLTTSPDSLVWINAVLSVSERRRSPAVERK